jgi:cell division septum initiation protein DivIVA
MGYEDEDPFDVVIFGYRREQVDEYLRIQVEQEQARLAQSLRLANLEQRLEEAMAENARLRSAVARLSDDLTLSSATVGAGSRIQEMLRLAEQEAAAIRAEASTYADQLRRQAREDANLAAAQRKSVNGSKLLG